jgi:hypothetical protein
MKLEQIIYTPSVRVKFTKREIAVLMELSAMHYDGACVAAGRQGGFLYGISNGNDELTWRQCDLLGKICEGASFWERSPRVADQKKGVIGRRLFGETLWLMKAMEFAKKCSDPVAESSAEQFKAQKERDKAYYGPLPYQGDEVADRAARRARCMP